MEPIKAKLIVDLVIGLPVDQAERLVKDYGMRCRISRIDGKSLIGTRDLRMDRVNLEVSNNVIVGAQLG